MGRPLLAAFTDVVLLSMNRRLQTSRVTMSTSTIPGVADFTGKTATTLESVDPASCVCLLSQILVVAIAGLQQRLAPDVVLARGAVKDVGPDQRDSFARQKHVQVHHLDRADDFALGSGSMVRPRMASASSTASRSSIPRLGIARGRGRSRGRREQAGAGNCGESRRVSSAGLL